jgi:hypothetical protein
VPGETQNPPPGGDEPVLSLTIGPKLIWRRVVRPAVDLHDDTRRLEYAVADSDQATTGVRDGLVRAPATDAAPFSSATVARSAADRAPDPVSRTSRTKPRLPGRP